MFDAIAKRARGSPLFAIQLALGLRASGALVLAHGSCLLSTDGGEEALQSLPDTLQRTILARFDRLSGALQIALKVASAFGGPFSAKALQAVAWATEPDRPEPLTFAGLIRAGILTKMDRAHGAPEGDEYDFSQPVAREAIYGVIPFVRRRGLHEGIAHYLERAPAGTIPPNALLGLHWARAGRPDKAIVYWERAGAAALEGGAYREAARAYAEAVQAADRLGTGAPPATRVAMLHQNLGESLLHSGDLAKSRIELQRALALLGRPFGRSLPRNVLALIRYSSLLLWREVSGRQTVVGPCGIAVEPHGRVDPYLRKPRPGVWPHL